MLHLAPERDGWKPKIIRTVATENKGLDEVASVIAEYRDSSSRRTQRREKDIEHWKLRLVALAEELFLRRAISGSHGESALDALAREVASRKKDPYAAARELLTRADSARTSA